MDTDRFLNVDEIAERVGKHRRTVLRWCTKDNGPFRSVAVRDTEGRWHVPESVVQEFIDRQGIVLSGQGMSSQDTGGVVSGQDNDRALALIEVQQAMRHIATKESVEQVAAELVRAQAESAALRSEICALRELLEQRLPEPKAKRVGMLLRVKAMLRRDRSGR